jgi:hypothetical protein
LDRAVAGSLELLRRRVRYVVRHYAQGELLPLIGELGELGEVVLFGGVLRDLALNSPSAFRSDVDVVVVAPDEHAFDSFFRDKNARMNRFGGYRVALSGGSIDVWPLQRTWAFKTGALQGALPSDLIKTTYFSWDSIAYSWRTGELLCRNTYLSDIKRGVVDIEFPDNPYPLGALVRTFRLLVSRRAWIGFRLARHTFRLLEGYGPREIVKAERRGFAKAYLDESMVVRLTRLMARSLLRGEKYFSVQPSLPFPSDVLLGQSEALGRSLWINRDETRE